MRFFGPDHTDHGLTWSQSVTAVVIGLLPLILLFIIAVIIDDIRHRDQGE